MATEQDYNFMRRALALARGGCGNVSPNPMVGAVIVDSAGRVIGEGYHRRFGGPHAEVNAVRSVGDRSLLRGSTVYVTLEPCSHYGKTPPCANLLVECGVGRVVVGAGDPNPKVSGRGIAILREHGIEVEEGVLADECNRLNAAFVTAHTLGHPFVTLKWAQSADGFIDAVRGKDDAPAAFSTPLTRTLTHRLRSLNDAILVGSGTVLADNPRLDCRLWPAGRAPQPVVLDRRMRVLSTSGVYLMSGQTDSENAPMITGSDSLADLLAGLYRRNITSLLVEGGAMVLRSFIEAGLWDAARVETAPFSLGARGAVRAPSLPPGSMPSSTVMIDGRRLDFYSNNPLVSGFAEL